MPCDICILQHLGGTHFGQSFLTGYFRTSGYVLHKSASSDVIPKHSSGTRSQPFELTSGACKHQHQRWPSSAKLFHGRDLYFESQKKATLLGKAFASLALRKRPVHAHLSTVLQAASSSRSHLILEKGLSPERPFLALHRRQLAAAVHSYTKPQYRFSPP